LSTVAATQSLGTNADSPVASATPVAVPAIVPNVDPAVLARHYYEDHEAYKLEFFAKTVRQASPAFHNDIEKQLWSGSRYNGFKVFRDGAKTTLLRLFTSKRIAYGISRTIVYISNSADNAQRSIDWLKKQVENNSKWATFYGLRPSPTKWAADEIEIDHTLLGIKIRVIAIGIKGQTRGINIDDYRPDLIIVDDADDEETTNTPEQCKKHVKLFFGAIVRTLCPATENPHAMIAVLQTPLANGDIIDTCSNDPQWHVTSIGCFKSDGTSSWPERYPVATLLAEKTAMISKRLLSVWLREMEVTIGSDEGADFQPGWLKYYTTLPEHLENICISIDPASSDKKTADDNAITVWGKVDAHYYLIAYSAERGQTHIDTSKLLFDTFYPLAKKLLKGRNPIVAIETIGYQRNLKAQIDADQRKHGVFFAITSVQDRRAKRDRILQSFHGNGYAGLILCHESHSKFIEQFLLYSKDIAHDDVIDASAMAIFQLDPCGTSYAAVATGGVKRAFSGIRVGRNPARIFGSSIGTVNAN
jgi:phage terminase large subunit-like protein